jgi:hypothetical protein
MSRISPVRQDTEVMGSILMMVCQGTSHGEGVYVSQDPIGLFEGNNIYMKEQKILEPDIF